jgi:hypothetical protein
MNQRAKVGEPTLAQLWTTTHEELPEWVRFEDVTLIVGIEALNVMESIHFIVHL